MHGTVGCNGPLYCLCGVNTVHGPVSTLDKYYVEWLDNQKQIAERITRTIIVTRFRSASVCIVESFDFCFVPLFSFGMQHDGIGNRCTSVASSEDAAAIMAAQLNHNIRPFNWSSCSREYITAFLE